MADRVIDLCARLFNAALAAFAAFALFGGRRGWKLMRRFGLDYEDFDRWSLIIVLLAAAAGFIWGKNLWRNRDPWTSRRGD